MASSSQKIVLVTGASSGYGRMAASAIELDVRVGFSDLLKPRALPQRVAL